MNDEENIFSTDEFKEDYENTLRPQCIDEFIGQADLKKILRFFWKHPKYEKELWIMFFFMVLQVWAKQP